MYATRTLRPLRILALLTANVAEAYRRAAANGYVPYVALRALDQLSSTPPPGYPGD